MALTGLRTESFFSDKNRAFWILQGGGWGAYFVLRGLGGLANKMGLTFILPTFVVTLTGFSLTLLMAAAFRRIIRMKPIWMWPLTLLILGTAALLFSVIEVRFHAWLYEPGWNPVGIEFFGAILLDLSVLGAWTALYYGINYYLLLSAQSERMLKVAAQANAAQLAMLRYQLNPHFLFNTLNSISTLVLLKQTERANAMLSRLSSFLRYSLVGDPTQMVSVAQEVEALRQYLDIERMRFEQRLRFTVTVDPRATQGQVPSLLLQPLVENAIKYAVTPMEEGADIALDARVVSDRLVITLTDTGPGLNDTAPKLNSSSGVGLANIRDRLAQAYGSDHRFELGPNQPTGLIVTIDIPYLPGLGAGAPLGDGRPAASAAAQKEITP
ncbi:sensor histidine kinase [Sphingoaurantiacus capsulatus]|uniref:Sensor histidine kinase n=1 Tax=Sphingoaurantiacus capsulatus TaxID=1771310 RepID=A0ABV7XA97_9SPHN